MLYSFFDILNKLNCNEFFNFSNILLQLIILIIYLIRFIKFIEIKKFLFENEDIYKEDSYFPNKVFNIDSFPIALSINIFIFYLLYIIFPNKINCCEFDDYLDGFEDYDLIVIIYLYLIPLLIGYFIVGVFDFLNDKKIKENYERLISNWGINPIISINLSFIEEDKYENYSLLNDYSIINNETKYISFWEKYSLEYKRMDYYNYFEINKNKDYYSKKCGKDNYGNDLYFPNDVYCPINEILFSDSDEDLIGFTKLKINDTFYLYYTNESVDGKIILDIQSSNSFNDLSSIPFNEEIYSHFDNQYFYAVNYLGINNTLIPYKTSKSIINNLEHNIKVYFSLTVVKIIFFCIENISIFITGCFISAKSYIIILFILIKIAYITILIISLNIHNIYINNFMNKLNLDLAIEKNDIKWNVIILIYSLIFFFIYLFILFGVICDTGCRFSLKYYYKEKAQIYIKDNNKKEFDKDTIVNSTDSEKSEKRINKNNKINELKKEIGEKNENIRLLNEKLNTLKKNKNKEINELKKNIKNLGEIIDSQNQEILKEKKEKNELFKELNDLKENTKNILALINEKEKEINFVKSNLPFEFKEGEKLMCVIFQCTDDQTLHYPMICKNTQIFNTLENSLYEKYNKYKKTENYFVCNGNRILKSTSLEENGIKDGSIIMMTVIE